MLAVAVGEVQQPLSRRVKLALVVEIVVAYARARWLLRHTDLVGALEILRASGDDSRLALDDPALEQATGIRLGRAVTRTLRLAPFDSRCLTRSLVLTVLLARRGIESVLVIGVQPKPDFRAHAWVEHGDLPLLPRHGSAYRSLVRL